MNEEALVEISYVPVGIFIDAAAEDLLLEHLYERDIASGTLTRDEAKLLILDFYCKNNLIMGRGEHQLSGNDPTVSTGWARCLCYDAPQYLVLAVVPEEYKDTTVNLKSPIMINTEKMLAVQTIAAENYPIKFPIFKKEGE